MPEKRTIKKAQADKRQGKSPSTQASEFVHESIDHIRKGKHGAKNAKQAIAIGLSEARRAGVDIPDKAGSKSRPKRKAATRTRATKAKSTETSRRRSLAATRALKRQPRRAASRTALSRQAHGAARKRTKADRSASAK